MSDDDFSAYYNYVPFWFWPVLWLSIRGLKHWEDQEREARGGVPGQYIMDVTWYGRIVIYYVSDRPLADDQWYRTLKPLDLEALNQAALGPGSAAYGLGRDDSLKIIPTLKTVIPEFAKQISGTQLQSFNHPQSQAPP